MNTNNIKNIYRTAQYRVLKIRMHCVANFEIFRKILLHNTYFIILFKMAFNIVQANLTKENCKQDKDN